MKPFGKQEDSGGLIATYGLRDWWLSTFSDRERAHIQSVFERYDKMLDLPGEDVGLFDLYFAERPPRTAVPGQTAAGFVCGILSTFDKGCKLCGAAVAVSRKDYSIASRILEKALDLAEKSPDPLYSHFGASFLPSVYAVLQYGIKMHYENREMYPGALDKAIEFCEKQIARAPKAAEAFRHEVPGCDLPKHLGFEQLAIILEKQGRLDETIALCEQAKRQGWKSDWDKRIARCSRKKEKSSKSSTGIPSLSPSPENRTHMECACPHCGSVLG